MTLKPMEVRNNSGMMDLKQDGAGRLPSWWGFVTVDGTDYKVFGWDKVNQRTGQPMITLAVRPRNWVPYFGVEPEQFDDAQ